MGKCISCKKEIGDDKFCVYCGERQECASCGERFTNKSRFCANCGAERDANQVEQQDEQKVAQHTEHQEETTATTQPLERSQQTSVQGGPPIQQSAQQTSQSNNFIEALKRTVTNMGKRNLIIIGVVIVALVAFFVFNPFGNQGPEDVVENFFTAISDADTEKVKQYMHPSLLSDVQEEFVESLAIIGNMDVTFEVLNVEQIDVSEDYVEFEAVVAVSAASIYEETDTVEIELTQIDNKWVISDMY